ncbi:hypothetical protein ZEAMMB73_Zm00001d028351 [Zea mays]|uniref:pectinesterase n=1 Tax=Zea mays TaxID=4577 RepID=A0A1D6JVC6_MAIZE|nr:hypothetical protein ZEAMMB73_Zm00001d028351 [Zea mays]
MVDSLLPSIVRTGTDLVDGMEDAAKVFDEIHQQRHRGGEMLTNCARRGVRLRSDQRLALSSHPRAFPSVPWSLRGPRPGLTFVCIATMSSVEYQPSTIAVASILVARGRETPAGNLDALKAILGSSFPQLDIGHVYSCYSAIIREDDKSPTQSTSTSTGVASSGVSVVAHAGGSGSPSLGASVSVGANNAAGTAPPATTDNRNKRRQLRSPQRQGGPKCLEFERGEIGFFGLVRCRRVIWVPPSAYWGRRGCCFAEQPSGHRHQDWSWCAPAAGAHSQDQELHHLVRIFDKGHCDLLEQQDYDLHQTHSAIRSDWHRDTEQCNSYCGRDEFILENDVFKNSAPQVSGQAATVRVTADRCIITGNEEATYMYLGRPWEPFGRVVFAKTFMELCIEPVGWHNWDKPENEQTACFYEYRSQPCAPVQDQAYQDGYLGAKNCSVMKLCRSFYRLSLIQISRIHGWSTGWELRSQFQRLRLSDSM